MTSQCDGICAVAVQEAWRTSVFEHQLTRYTRALGTSVMRHQSQCRTEVEWARVDALRGTGGPVGHLMDRYINWKGEKQAKSSSQA